MTFEFSWKSTRLSKVRNCDAADWIRMNSEANVSLLKLSTWNLKKRKIFIRPKISKENWPESKVDESIASKLIVDPI